MINQSSFIKTVAVIITVAGLTVGCGSKLNLKDIKEKALASFDDQKAELNSNKEKTQQDLEDKKGELSKKDKIIGILQKGLDLAK
jgi:prefoldin subunit 5